MNKECGDALYKLACILICDKARPNVVDTGIIFSIPGFNIHVSSADIDDAKMQGSDYLFTYFKELLGEKK